MKNWCAFRLFVLTKLYIRVYVHVIRYVYVCIHISYEIFGKKFSVLGVDLLVFCTVLQRN